jgi:hypothetical protein
MKRPLICLAICLGAVALGSAICLPGICGCVGWLPVPNRDSFGTPFIFLSFGGVLGVFISLVWLVVATLRRAVLVARLRSRGDSQAQ